MNILEKYESAVRSYCRVFPVVFEKAKGSLLYTETGKTYIDFLSGAGALNYGHNNEFIKDRLKRYIEDDGIIQGLDMYTTAKQEFVEAFVKKILKPKGLEYKLQFCGPTGTNAVEAAIKLARKVKGRSNIFSFMGGYHGVSLGSLSATGNIENRAGAGVPLGNVVFFPYPGKYSPIADTINYIESVIADPHSGIEKPAAIIFETIQAEGGVNVAPFEWLKKLEELCHKQDILLICDDIQVGCGRTGTFFSFERANITPDIVILSKSISGYGLPMSLILFKPELDLWKPGEHSGTFRGNQLAFVSAKAALEYREIYNLEKQVSINENFIKDYMEKDILDIHRGLTVRGIGMIWGIDFSDVGGGCIAKQVAQKSFEYGLIVEVVGRNDAVIKLIPPLTIEKDYLQAGCSIIKQAMTDTFNDLPRSDEELMISEISSYATN